MRIKSSVWKEHEPVLLVSPELTELKEIKIIYEWVKDIKTIDQEELNSGILKYTYYGDISLRRTKPRVIILFNYHTV